ncbi:MAG: cupin domain-containing protein [Gammaproteobacteria bacterium]|nr:cupin domain-containing protein [Gammaproteobacteria bacterium]
MKTAGFPKGITELPDFDGPFDAHKLSGDGCDVLFASYPAGTCIDFHTHSTENYGVITAGELVLLTDKGERRYGTGDWYHLDPHERHAARFEVDTAEIEFWFKRD